MPQIVAVCGWRSMPALPPNRKPTAAACLSYRCRGQEMGFTRV